MGSFVGLMSDRYLFPTKRKAEMCFDETCEYSSKCKRFSSDFIYISITALDNLIMTLMATYISPEEREKRIREKKENKQHSAIIELEKNIRLLKSDPEFRTKYSMNIESIKAKRSLKYVNDKSNHLLLNIANPRVNKQMKAMNFVLSENYKKSSAEIRKKVMETQERARKMIKIERIQIKTEHVYA
jgi:hypothetical protein